MKKPWKPVSSAGGNARPRTGPHHIRGRISGPVPVSSPLDEEFPLRSPGPNITTPIRAEFKDSQAESLLSGRDQQPMALPHASSPLNDMSPSLNDNSHSTQRIVSPVAEMRSSPGQRTNSSNANRHLIVSPDVTQMKDNRPNRKQSKLRGAIGKLLGRRRKPHPYDSLNADSDTGPPSTTRPIDYHTSDSKASHQHETDPRPTNRPDPRVRSRPFPGAESKRSASLPITEFDRALRSHSIRPEDVRAIESARNSLSADFGTRRLTAPLGMDQDDVTGLSPRPASSQGRDSRTTQHDGDPGEIGRAITSDHMGYRRRSRSLSGLPEVEEDQSKSRRRSDEIRYWRESYDPAFTSPVSSNILDMDDNGAAEGDDPPQIRRSFQLNNFARVHEMGDTKITHAANIESRVSNLESRVRRLEHALNQVCNAVPGLRPPLDPPDQPAPQVPTTDMHRGFDKKPPLRLSMDQTKYSCSFKAHRRDISVLSLDDSLDEPIPEPIPNSLPVPRPSDRPTSITTIRGVSSLPTLTKEASGPFTMDHYATLLALVHTERSAREALEAQVKRLGYQVSILARSNALGGGTHYDPPPTAKSFGDRSAFDHDDGQGDMTMMIDAQMRLVDPEDSGIGTVHGDESVYSETLETPHEEGYNFGAFGEDLGEENQQKKSARTLSLSQITRKNQPVSQSLPQAF